MNGWRTGLVALMLLLSAAGLSACKSDADTVSDNLSKEAEKFNVARRIVGINGITDKVEFEVVGRCSLERSDSMKDTLDVICKEGPGSYSKHHVGLSDNMFFVSTQLEGVEVSRIRTKVILKPQSIVPDLVTG